MKTCTIQDCDSPLLAKGLCRKHYLRQYKHGDASIVKQAKDYVCRGVNSPNYKHGLWNHPLYKTWKNMMSRCYTITDRAYSNYGGRGIDVCSRWHSLELFIEDMPARPIGLSLDRIDTNKGYSPENCRWADDLTQNQNRRVSKMDESKARLMRKRRAEGAKRKELAVEFGVSESTVKKVISGAYWSKTQQVSESIADAIKRK